MQILSPGGALGQPVKANVDGTNSSTLTALKLAPNQVWSGFFVGSAAGASSLTYQQWTAMLYGEPTAVSITVNGNVYLSSEYVDVAAWMAAIAAEPGVASVTFALVGVGIIITASPGLNVITVTDLVVTGGTGDLTEQTFSGTDFYGSGLWACPLQVSTDTNGAASFVGTPTPEFTNVDLNDATMVLSADEAGALSVAVTGSTNFVQTRFAVYLIGQLVLP